MASQASSCLVDNNCCTNKEIVNLPDVQELIRKLQLLNWRQEDIAVLVRRLIGEFGDNASVDWIKYCQTGPEGINYKRVLLCEDKEFTLQLLCFQPRMGNRIHDHGKAQCCFKVLHGKILEKQYKRPTRTGEMKWKAKRIYEEGEINESSISLHLHCCRNLRYDIPAVTIVLYYPAISQVHVYDEKTGEANLKNLTFDAPDHGVRPKQKGSIGIEGVVNDDHDT